MGTSLGLLWRCYGGYNGTMAQILGFKSGSAEIIIDSHCTVAVASASRWSV